MAKPASDIIAERTDEITRLFQGMGLETKVCRKPDDPFDGVVGVFRSFQDRQRQIAALFEGDPPSLWYYLSRTYPIDSTGQVQVIDPKDMHRVTGYGASAPIDLATHEKAIRGALILANPDDPIASAAEIRETLDHITDPERNASFMGNPRGDDLRAIGHILERLLERIERLEKQRP